MKRKTKRTRKITKRKQKGGKKDRCARYKNKKTFGLPKNYVYKKCKRCPQNKTWKVSSFGKPGYRDVGDACQNT